MPAPAAPKNPEEERLRAYLNAAKRQENMQHGLSASAAAASSPTTDDSDYRDLETFESLADMDTLVNSVLSKDANLKELLSQQDAELEGYMNGFIQAHCDEAENLCSLYHQVTECEGRLNDFESQIRDFLDRLTETADEVMQMQRSTDDLHTRVTNRKAVKAEITLVYEAIMECGKFCDDIVSRDVDAAFLHEMRAYDAKLSKWNSLLESNPNLRGSAVDLEISPRLASAARRVGDKLERYMATRFAALQDVGINVVLHQQIMEATGMFAFRFLASYNTAVAERLKLSYLGIIAEVHGKAVAAALRDVLEAGTYAALPYEAVLPATALKAIESGKDLAVQRDFFMAVTKAFGGQALSLKDRTLSAEAAILGLPPLASPQSCRFYLREDEYLAEFVASNALSDTPSPSGRVPRRAPSVVPTASPVASGGGQGRAASVGGSGGRAASSARGGGSSSSGGGISLGGLASNLNSMKAFVKQQLATPSAVAKELSNASPFANTKDLRAATFENQVHSLRAIHILEAATAAASAAAQQQDASANGASSDAASGKKGATSPALGVSPERRSNGAGSLASSSPAAGGHGPLGASAPSSAAAQGAADGSSAAASAVPPNYMGTIVLDPIVVGRLARTDCWAIRFISLLTTIVNAITAERKFVRNFFLGHVRDTLRGDLAEEGILRTIFTHPLAQAEAVLGAEIAALTDPITMLVALRAVELLKNFVFQCPSPNPIMLLSTLFGSVSAALRDGLYKFLSSDERSLQAGLGARLPQLEASAFPALAAAPTFNGEVDVVALVQQDPLFASALTVHPTVVAVAQLTAKLHALNVLHLKGSYVDVGSDATTFDDTVESSLRGIMGGCYSLIDRLAGRFGGLSSRVPSLVFVIVNLGHILYRWLAAARSAKGMPSSMPLLVSHHRSGRRGANANASANNSNAAASASPKEAADAAPTALMLKAQLLFDDEDIQREAKNTGGTAAVAKGSAEGGDASVSAAGGARSVSPARGGGGGAPRSISPSRARFVAAQSLSQLDQTLSDSIAAFVNADIAARYGGLKKAMDVIDAIEATLGPAGLSPSASVSTSDPSAATSSAPQQCPVDAATFADAAAALATGWQEQLARIRSSLKALFTTTVMLMVSGQAPPPQQQNGQGLLMDSDALLRAAEAAVGATGAAPQPMAAALPHVNAAVLGRASEANELMKRVLHDYYRVVVDTNAKMAAAARRYFSGDTNVSSKLIGPHALEHELQRLLMGR